MGAVSLKKSAKTVSERYNKLLFALDAGAENKDANSPRDAKIASSVGVSEIGAEAGEYFRPRAIGGEVRPRGEIVDVGIVGHDYRNLAFEQGDTVRFRMRVRFRENTPHVIMGMMITTATGVDCYHTNLLCRDLMIESATAGETYAVTFEMPLSLNAGSYIAVFDCQYDMRATPKLVDIFYEALKFTIVPERLIDDGGIAALGAKIECQNIGKGI